VINAVAGTFDFGTVADRYDRWYETAHGAVYDRIEKQTVARALPHSGHGNELIEIGCGTGHWSRFFAGRGFHVTGTDISHEMVRVAAGKPTSDVRFSVADAANLPFPDGSFDVAAAVTVLEFVAEPRRVMQETARCIRPGGRIVVGALNRYSMLGIRHRVRPSGVVGSANMFSRSELQGLLSDFGRTTVRAAAFVIPWRWLLWATPALDALGRTARLPWGDFLVGEVRL